MSKIKSFALGFGADFLTLLILEVLVLMMVSDEPAPKIQAFLRNRPFSFRFLRVRRPLLGVNSRPVAYVYDASGTLEAKAMGAIEAPTRLRALVPAQ